MFIGGGAIESIFQYVIELIDSIEIRNINNNNNNKIKKNKNFIFLN